MAHLLQAPAGGCSVLGTWYEGGQFLPEHGDTAPKKPSLRQLDAEATRAARLAADQANSRHVGSIGERIKVTVTVAVVLAFDGFYGPTYLTIARDAAGNVFVSKGKAWAEKEAVAQIVASVKGHEVHDGVQQTIIQRVKVS